MYVKCLLIVPVKMIFPGFVKTELIKLVKIAGVMHEADHTYSTEHLVITSINYRCTMHRLCYQFAKHFCMQLGFVEVSLRIWIEVIFLVLSICLLFVLVYFMSDAECHCSMIILTKVYI